MSSFQNEMRHAVQGFMAQISELARRAAIDTVQSAFEARARRGNGVRAAVGPGARRPKRVGRPPGVGRPKRTSADLDALSEKFATFVKGHPGLRIEQINKELETTTRDLALPIRKLISADLITAKGTRRATTYFAGKKAARS